MCSWFAFSREAPIRALPITRSLQRVRQGLGWLHGQGLAGERVGGVQQSRPLHEDFRGIALAWCQGAEIGPIAMRARIAEGDLVSTLQKTLDVIGQLKDAVHAARRGMETLLPLLEEADA